MIWEFVIDFFVFGFGNLLGEQRDEMRTDDLSRVIWLFLEEPTDQNQNAHELFVYGPPELHKLKCAFLHKYKTQLFPKSCVYYLPNTIFGLAFLKMRVLDFKR